jgi:hypothetical protein
MDDHEAKWLFADSSDGVPQAPRFELDDGCPTSPPVLFLTTRLTGLPEQRQTPIELSKLPTPLWLARDTEGGADCEWAWRTLRS